MNLEFPTFERPIQDFENYLTDHPARRTKKPARAPSRLHFREVPGWKYRGTPRQGWPWFGMAVAGSSMALGLFAFNGHPKPKVVAAEPEPALILVDLPKILPDPDEEPGDDRAPTSDAAVDVPALPDLPSTVTTENAFVQQIDYSTFRPHSNVNAANLSAIPALIRHGGAESALRNLKEIFNLSDLDRVPEPVFQPVPKVSDSMLNGAKQAHVTVEFIVTSTGDVLDVEIIQEDSRDIGEAAIRAVSRWKFHPGVKKGKHVNSRVRQPLVFKPSAD